MNTPRKRHKVLLVMIRDSRIETGAKGRVLAWITEEELAQAKAGRPPAIGPDREVIYAARRRRRSYLPGQVIRIEATDPQASAVWWGTEEYLGLWPDPAARAEWANQNDWFHAKVAEERAAKRDAKDDPLDHLTLDELRALYRRAPGSRRRAFLLARVFERITSD